MGMGSEMLENAAIDQMVEEEQKEQDRKLIIETQRKILIGRAKESVRYISDHHTRRVYDDIIRLIEHGLKHRI
jgi:hypothetical protein